MLLARARARGFFERLSMLKFDSAAWAVREPLAWLNLSYIFVNRDQHLASLPAPHNRHLHLAPRDRHSSCQSLFYRCSAFGTTSGSAFSLEAARPRKRRR